LSNQRFLLFPYGTTEIGVLFMERMYHYWNANTIFEINCLHESLYEIWKRK
jgi:hypothetical protein